MPQSSTATYRTIRTAPVSLSTSTTQMWAPNGQTKLVGSKKVVASSPPSIPLGIRLVWKAATAISWMVMAFEGEPLTKARPPSYTTSSSARSEEHTSELQSPDHLVCRLLLEK